MSMEAIAGLIAIAALLFSGAPGKVLEGKSKLREWLRVWVVGGDSGVSPPGVLHPQPSQAAPAVVRVPEYISKLQVVEASIAVLHSAQPDWGDKLRDMLKNAYDNAAASAIAATLKPQTPTPP